MMFRSSLIAAVLAGATMLAGCSSGGFRPLYAGGQSGPVATSLSSVHIVPVEGRVGQVVRNELLFFFTGGGAGLEPKYRLEILVAEGNQAAIVDPFSGRPEVVSMSLEASFVLRASDAGPSSQPLLKGRTFARASYTTTLQRFANIRAQRDAEDRAAKVLAEQIRTQVAGFFATAS